MSMSEKDLRMAAEKNLRVDSAKQNKIMEEAIAKSKARVAELNAMKAEEEAAKLQQEKEEKLSQMSKRQRLEAQKEELAKEEVVEEIHQSFSPSKATNSSLFKPFAHTQKKEKIEEVPSGGLSYPDGWEIYITPYSGDDLDDLNNSKLSLKYILTKCLEGVYTNFDKQSLTFYDALYLSFCRRVLSIGENLIEVASQCPHCERYTKRTIDVTKEIEFEDSKIPALPINVEFSFGKLSFTYLTYKDFMNLRTELKSEELAYQCCTECEIDTEKGEVREEELQKLFGSLTGQDADLLNYIRELTYHGIKPILTLCQNKDCGQSFEMLIDEMSSIILPFRRRQEDTRSKVSFG